ncbi:MAG: orotate phosphoribosyltransferase [Bacteroidota bacterium]|nr:orotate phosphoribosyltransferase [Bacteroidota bacterium]
MKYNEESAQKVAEFLLQINAVKLNAAEPFTWASGLKSPIYCDNRITLSFPKIRDFIREEFTKVIRNAFEIPDVLAGVATGGIAQGALVAQEFDKPFVYIRSSQKAHGLENKIEGVVEKGQKVVVIEDLVSTGKSSLHAVNALISAGCEVIGMVAIFSYNLEIALENFEKAGVKLYTLSDYESLIRKALEIKYISDADHDSLVEWRKNPKKWAENF